MLMRETKEKDNMLNELQPDLRELLDLVAKRRTSMRPSLLPAVPASQSAKERLR